MSGLHSGGVKKELARHFPDLSSQSFVFDLDFLTSSSPRSDPQICRGIEQSVFSKGSEYAKKCDLIDPNDFVFRWSEPVPRAILRKSLRLKP